MTTIKLSPAAQLNADETGADPAADVAAIRSGAHTRESLLAHCLDGADADREQGWREYAAAVSDAAIQADLPAWDFEGYWNTVLGAQLDAAGVVRDFALDPSDRRGLDEWLGQAESVAWTEGRQGGEMPDSWGDFHTSAVDKLASVTVE